MSRSISRASGAGALIPHERVDRMKIIVAITLCVIIGAGCKTKQPVPKEPTKSEKPVAPRADVDILFCGDVMFDWGISEVMLKNGHDYPVRHLRRLMFPYDYRFCNVESPISDTGTVHSNKKYVFLAKPFHIQLLTACRINGVSLSNNHSNDFGHEALMNTIALLEENDIAQTGAGKNLIDARRPIIFTIRKIRFAIFAYSAVSYSDSYANKKTPGVAASALSIIRQDIRRYRKKADHIIISLHWGIEYSDYPSKDQVSKARALINSGADVIIGHHPHIYQGIEIYRNRPIIYSLGNFIFGSINEDIRDNIMISVRFSRRKPVSMRVMSINGNRSEEPFSYSQLTGSKAGRVFKHLQYISRPLGKRFPDHSRRDGDTLLYRFTRHTTPR